MAHQGLNSKTAFDMATVERGEMDASWAWSTASSKNNSLKAWSAALPATGITIPASALQTLRSTVKSTVKTKPEFLSMHRTLGTSELDNRKIMGEPLEITQVWGLFCLDTKVFV